MSSSIYSLRRYLDAIDSIRYVLNSTAGVMANICRILCYFVISLSGSKPYISGCERNKYVELLLLSRLTSRNYDEGKAHEETINVVELDIPRLPSNIIAH